MSKLRTGLFLGATSIREMAGTGPFADRRLSGDGAP